MTFHSYRHVHYNEGESPLSRIAELFNVNHFIVSQARPYLSHFLRSELSFLDRRQAGPWNSFTRALMRLVTAELRHRLKQLDYVGLLPQPLSQFLMDETIPAPNLTLVPDLSLVDLPYLFRPPSKDTLAHWVLKGERGVWPAISALKVRCAIEVGLDKGYQIVRRRRPSGQALVGLGARITEQYRRQQQRSNSADPEAGLENRRLTVSVAAAQEAEESINGKPHSAA